MKYTELKKLNESEITAFPLFFAFSQEQLEEGLKDLDTTKELLVNCGGGMFTRKTDRKKLDEMFTNFETRMADNMKDDAFFLDAAEYELANHEYCYTYEIDDTLDSLSLSVDTMTDRQKELFQKAIRSCLKNSDC